MYKCDDCGAFFEHPALASDCVDGENSITYEACPHCKSDLICETVRCEMCDEYMCDDIMNLCDDCKSDLEQKMMVFEKWTTLSHDTFIEWIYDWLERNE